MLHDKERLDWIEITLHKVEVGQPSQEIKHTQQHAPSHFEHSNTKTLYHR